MKTFFGDRWQLGPNETLNLLFAPLSELELKKNLHDYLFSGGIQYIGDLLFMTEDKILSKVDGKCLMELRERVAKFGSYGFAIGMFAHLPPFVKILFEQAKGWWKVETSKLRFHQGYGNHHPAFPLSEAKYHGDISRRGEG